MTEEYLKAIAAQYGMQTYRDSVTGKLTGLYLYSDHRIGELDEIVLHSTTEVSPAICETFCPGCIRYVIHAPSE